MRRIVYPFLAALAVFFVLIALSQIGCGRRVVVPPPVAADPCANVSCAQGYACLNDKGKALCVAVIIPQDPVVVAPPEVPSDGVALPPLEKRGMALHPQNLGWDTTPIVVGDKDFCDKMGFGFWPDGAARYDCPLGVDQADDRHLRERQFLGQRCPSWWFALAPVGPWAPCKPGGGRITCDSFDTREVPPSGCDANTGFFAMVRGKGYIRTCTKDQKVCSAPEAVDY